MRIRKLPLILWSCLLGLTITTHSCSSDEQEAQEAVDQDEDQDQQQDQAVTAAPVDTAPLASIIPPSTASLAQAAAQAAPAQSAPVQQPTFTTYIVRRGDTLSRIAKRHYGDMHMYTVIAQASNIANPNRIFPGDVLRLPNRESMNAPVAHSNVGHAQAAQPVATGMANPAMNASNVTNPIQPANYMPSFSYRQNRYAHAWRAPNPNPQGIVSADGQIVTYTVVRGDTLSDIAQRTLGSDQKWMAIFDQNKQHIRSPDLIFEGQVFTFNKNAPPGGGGAQIPAH